MEVKVVRKEAPIKKVIMEFAESEAKFLVSELKMIRRELQNHWQFVRYWELAPYLNNILYLLEDNLKDLPKE